MKLRVAACQMTAELGDLAGNLARAERLIADGFAKGARWVILPELFSSAIGYHEIMHGAALPLDGPALAMMRAAARRGHGVVGGSFLSIRGEDRYNSFLLVREDGSYAVHDKDQPTVWENCYYTRGADDGVCETTGLRVGVALCWEMIRWRTVRRLAGRVDLVVGGTCWAGGPQVGPYKHLLRAFEEPARRVLAETPARLARLLGVPVVHASHAGPLTCRIPMLPGSYVSHFLGETQIVDRQGSIVARLKHEDGEGVIAADVETGAVAPLEEAVHTRSLWIPRLPFMLRLAWLLLNAHGEAYYARMKRRGIYTGAGASPAEIGPPR